MARLEMYADDAVVGNRPGGARAGEVTSVSSTPVNEAAPTIDNTSPLVGDTLTATAGTWTNNPTLTYQWQRDGVDISGATALTYDVTLADFGAELSVLEIPNGNAGAAVTSEPTAKVAIAPATNNLYTTEADGTYIWTVEQPTTPDYLDRLCGGWRVQDLSSNGSGAVQNGWEWRLEYQPNSTWTFSWYSVASGTPTAAIYTQTNIGTVTKVRVTLNGTSVSVETSDGISYTARGSTTSSLYQAQTGICASYTGKVGSQLVTNHEFASWSSGVPVGWTVDLGGTGVITQDANGMRVQSAGNNARPVISKTALTIVGNPYWFALTVHSVTSGGARWTIFPATDTASASTIVASSAGTVYGRGVSGNPIGNVSLYPLTTTSDVIVRRVELYAIGILDASGDGGFSLVEVA